MKSGKTYEEAHAAVLKEQVMGGMKVSEYENKLYAQRGLRAMAKDYGTGKEKTGEPGNAKANEKRDRKDQKSKNWH